MLHWLSALLIIIIAGDWLRMLEDLPNDQSKAPCGFPYDYWPDHHTKRQSSGWWCGFSTKNRPRPRQPPSWIKWRGDTLAALPGRVGDGHQPFGDALAKLPLVGGGTATVPPDFMVSRDSFGLISFKAALDFNIGGCAIS